MTSNYPETFCSSGISRERGKGKNIHLKPSDREYPGVTKRYLSSLNFLWVEISLRYFKILPDIYLFTASNFYFCERANHQNVSELENNTEALINQTGAAAEGGTDGGRGENEERGNLERERERERQRDRDSCDFISLPLPFCWLTWTIANVFRLSPP